MDGRVQVRRRPGRSGSRRAGARVSPVRRRADTSPAVGRRCRRSSRRRPASRASRDRAARPSARPRSARPSARTRPAARSTVTWLSEVTSTAGREPFGSSGIVEDAGRRRLIGRGQVGGRVHPAVGLRRPDAVQERSARERREVSRERGEPGVGRHAQHADDDRRAPAHHASDALGSMGSVANAGGQMTAASPGATHSQITLAAARLSPASGVPGAPNRRPLPFGRLPRRQVDRAGGRGDVGGREGGRRRQHVGEERPRGREAGERGGAHVLVPRRVVRVVRALQQRASVAGEGRRG